MIDPNYDPYDLLIDCVQQLNENTRVSHKLVNSHNAQEYLLAELTKQHQMICNQLAEQNLRLKHLEIHYQKIKNQLDEIKQATTDNSK
jgi:uncharacterized protein YpuA (DUF1002 family)